jgi:hypothetical protein
MNFIKTSTLTSCLVLFLSVALLIGCKPIFEKKPIPSKDEQAAAATAPAPEPAPAAPAPESEPAAPVITESVEIEDIQSLQSLDSTESDIDAISTDVYIDTEASEAPESVVDDGDDLVKPDTAMIRNIQQALVNAGFNPGPIDGKSGGKTTAAIEAFQKENGIASGKIDKRTLRALGVGF